MDVLAVFPEGVDGRDVLAAVRGRRPQLRSVGQVRRRHRSTRQGWTSHSRSNHPLELNYPNIGEFEMILTRLICIAALIFVNFVGAALQSGYSVVFYRFAAGSASRHAAVRQIVS